MLADPPPTITRVSSVGSMFAAWQVLAWRVVDELVSLADRPTLSGLLVGSDSLTVSRARRRSSRKRNLSVAKSITGFVWLDEFADADFWHDEAETNPLGVNARDEK